MVRLNPTVLRGFQCEFEIARLRMFDRLKFEPSSFVVITSHDIRHIWNARIQMILDVDSRNPCPSHIAGDFFPEFKL